MDAYSFITFAANAMVRFYIALVKCLDWSVASLEYESERVFYFIVTACILHNKVVIQTHIFLLSLNSYRVKGMNKADSNEFLSGHAISGYLISYCSAE